MPFDHGDLDGDHDLAQIGVLFKHLINRDGCLAAIDDLHLIQGADQINVVAKWTDVAPLAGCHHRQSVVQGDEILRRVSDGLGDFLVGFLRPLQVGPDVPVHKPILMVIIDFRQ